MKRILVCTEASYLDTGFSQIAKELLTRFHDTGKYEIYELGNYGSPEDPRSLSLSWQFMPVMPHSQDKEGQEQYNAAPIYQFGCLKHEDACLWARPSIHMSFLDPWMSTHFIESPFRKYYNCVMMPTVDSSPQGPDWIEMYSQCEGVFTYSEWANEVLEQQSGGRIKLKGTTSPGVDHHLFSPPADKKAHRKSLGVEENVFIVGFVARNQKRKLYPDLAVAFRQFLDTAPPELSNRTFMYWHTAHPDVGWNIPRLLKENRISHKVLFTYMCRRCGMVFPAFFQDSKTFCQKCGADTTVMPNSQSGVSREVLAQIYKILDAFVQYSCCEGVGIPQIEAASCGVPVFAVDYSAMSDVVRNTGGYPVKVKRMFRESETHFWRALPDNDDLVAKLIKFFTLPESIRAKKGMEAREGALHYYDWDKMASRWMELFDELPDTNDRWYSPAYIHRPQNNVPNLSDEQFVNWCLLNVAGRPDLVNSYFAMKLTRDLVLKYTTPGFGGVCFSDESALGQQRRVVEFTREHVFNLCMDMCNKRNYWEKTRVDKLGAK